MRHLFEIFCTNGIRGQEQKLSFDGSCNLQLLLREVHQEIGDMRAFRIVCGQEVIADDTCGLDQFTIDNCISLLHSMWAEKEDLNARLTPNQVRRFGIERNELIVLYSAGSRLRISLENELLPHTELVDAIMAFGTPIQVSINGFVLQYEADGLLRAQVERSVSPFCAFD